jgi:carbon-monoxide dehydrogenase medium subunit
MGSVAYHEPRTPAEVAELLSKYPEARCLAGGQTLVAEMNAGLQAPKILVSLRRVEGLHEITEASDGEIIIGAMATHRMIAQSEVFRDGRSLLRVAASSIASPAIRATATIGGSICRADARLDYPAVLLALDATIDVRSAADSRSIPAGEFFIGLFETSLRAGEFVTHVRIPAPPAGSVGIYERVSRVDHDIATVSVALVLGLRNEVCSYVALAIGSCGPRPIRSREAEARLRESKLAGSDVTAASKLLVEQAMPASDVRGSSEYRSMLITRLVDRALKGAMHSCSGNGTANTRSV